MCGFLCCCVLCICCCSWGSQIKQKKNSFFRDIESHTLLHTHTRVNFSTLFLFLELLGHFWKHLGLRDTSTFSFQGNKRLKSMSTVHYLFASIMHIGTLLLCLISLVLAQRTPPLLPPQSIGVLFWFCVDDNLVHKLLAHILHLVGSKNKRIFAD